MLQICIKTMFTVSFFKQTFSKKKTHFVQNGNKFISPQVSVELLTSDWTI